MMMFPLRGNRQRMQVADTASRPAPVGGWNARDGLAMMKPGDAVILDNYFPNTSSCDLRGGTERYATFVGQLSAFTRASVGTYFDDNIVLQTAAVDTPRYSYRTVDSGASIEESRQQPLDAFLLIESAATNECLYNRDLTNAAWTKTNLTASKTQTGIDGVANSATILTATSANGIASQAIVSASNTGRVLSIYARKLTNDNSALSISLDNDATRTGVLQDINTWQLVSRTQTLANPTIVIKIDTNGAQWAVDFVQETTGSTVTSPIATTSVAVTRAADTPTYASGADADTAPEPVESLMVYSSGTTNKMIAAANNNIYDVSSGQRAILPLATGLANDRWSSDHMGGYIVMVNGEDTPRKYNGSAITTTTISGSGLTATSLSYVCQLHNRLFFIEKNTLSAWYLDANAIAGTATELDFTGLCSLGGRLVAIGKWTRDGGSGMDDVSCFFTDKGEVLVYSGSDPADADSWALIGVFRIGAPIGDRPLMSNGADLIVMTEDGYAPLSKILPLDRVGTERNTISDKIRDAVTKATRTYKNNFGWQCILYPRGNFALFNVPIREGLKAEQHVINTITGAWGRFKGIEAVCWAIYNNNLYFGAKNGFVCLADTDDYADDSLVNNPPGTLPEALNLIQGDILPAYDYFGSKAQQKQFTMIRPVISSNGNPGIALTMNTDFERGTPTPIDTVAQSGTPWGSPWGSHWGSGNKIRKNWVSVSGIGYCGAPHIRTRTSGTRISLNSIDYAFKRGGVL